MSNDSYCSGDKHPCPVRLIRKSYKKNPHPKGASQLCILAVHRSYMLGLDSCLGDFVENKNAQ